MGRINWGDLKAQLAEFEAVPGELLLGPDKTALSVIVTAFADPKGVRIVIADDEEIEYQLVIDQEALQKIAADPQALPEP